MIMGRKTYETTPKALMLDHQSIVLSHDSSLFLEYAKVVTSLDECLRYIDGLNTHCNIFMIGGSQIAHLFLANNLISSFIFTQIHKTYLGDTHLNLNYFKLWSKSILKYFLSVPSTDSLNLFIPSIGSEGIGGGGGPPISDPPISKSSSEGISNSPGPSIP